MIQGTNTTKKYSVHFSVCTDDERGLLWLEVVTYEPNSPRQVKDFPGDKYGDAIKYYEARQNELKQIYGV